MVINHRSPLYMDEEGRGKKRKELDFVVQQLNKHPVVLLNPQINNVGAFDYIVQFTFSEIKVTVYLCFYDHQVLSDLVITNMTTLPAEERGKGWGSKVVSFLLDWGRENGFNEIRATQVGNPDSERFWEKNGFILTPEPNECGDWVYIFE